MTRDFAAGNYRYLPAGFQFSSGVAADPDFEIERVRFDKPVALADGFSLIADHILGAGRPLTALCACELRSPAALDGDGFRDFNRHYVKTLVEWEIYDGSSENNPVARSNVCPEIDPPAEPSFYAFSFTRPALGASPTCVIAGSGESRGGDGGYPERLVRYRDMSPDGFREKVTFTMAEILARLSALGFGWNDVTGTQVYTVHDFHALAADELVRLGAARAGLTWHYARPPVVDMEFEVDARRVMREMVI
ncbi:hypothetical protein FNL55_10885 [Tardiphaga sp. vice352]|uniref:2-amino-5-chloromuconate deaminase CnbZ n=1 Tax=unclassified Tardiphaga TaxID=2631404 RepID=UPI00116272CC|nr:MULTISPECIES: hypothetical protein [unclassified Tardiphaga]QDM16488.1 hypothetical protein FNL53_11575 [Tardiphaga sp. vice278]QDM21512.1 hypothetical protein FIU28_10475 [Tardiphaga sp. vice154]QDM26698.1 hypothetical protein FNL56_11730 [Tardiphaga sp. vice304]QDM31762.1 hypothetical protein FNL55_10885 [Tardiphaga sp. vice352]